VRNRPQIFQALFQHQDQRNGIGLPIVKNMIESGNGTIPLHLLNGEGTTFTIVLPKQVK
jgi:signal transduction histidine kinase